MDDLFKMPREQEIQCAYMKPFEKKCKHWAMQDEAEQRIKKRAYIWAASRNKMHIYIWQCIQDAAWAENEMRIHEAIRKNVYISGNAGRSRAEIPQQG